MTDNNNIWTDKFIKREQLPAGELAQRFNIHNPRTHPETQRQATESSLDTVGWIDEISLSTNGNGSPSLADNPDAVMFDGHERVEIALVRGGPDMLVPVRWYQLTPEETDFALLAKDQTSAMAQIDPAKMAALMDRTKAMTTAPGLQTMLMQLKQKVADSMIGDENDPYQEWQGMPEFEQEDAFGAIATIKVHFETEQDIINFANLVEQTVNKNTTFIWYPRQKRENLKQYQAINESEVSDIHTVEKSL